ncbi:MAG: ATP-dependent Clp protease ATP-binding subunit [Bacteroidetes bacterium]|nr:ATP-dependent Clp protease ATP-binding subunit [Bacteroidota bacterium]
MQNNLTTKPQSNNIDVEIKKRFKDPKDSELFTPACPIDLNDFECLSKERLCNLEALKQIINPLIEETIAYIHGNLHIAIVCEDEVTADFFIGVLCYSLFINNSIIPISPISHMLNVKSLVEYGRKLPKNSILKVKALQVSMGSQSMYELVNEIYDGLSALSNINKQTIITGSFSEHQTVFGGQGAQNDPMNPIIINLNQISIPIEALIFHEIQKQTSSPSVPESITILKDIIAYTQTLSNDNKIKLINPLVSNALATTSSKEHNTALLLKTVDISASFSGVNQINNYKRSYAFQEKLNTTLTSDLYTFLCKSIIGQEDPINKVISRIQTEAITTSNTPISILLESQPGAGKTLTTKHLAKFLGIPRININASAFASFMDFRSGLLGSSFGLVGSYKSGLLEDISNAIQGCLVEISDIDHAPQHLRSQICDFFLKILQDSVQENAKNKGLYLGNTVFVFTSNLPDGKDELVRNTLGFANTANDDTIQLKIESELSKVYSAAFLSRVGRPIIYNTLTFETLNAILQLEIKNAILNAFNNLKISNTDIQFDIEGSALLSNIESIHIHGARKIVHFSKELVKDLIMSHSHEQFSKAKKIILDKTQLKIKNN